MCAFIIHHAGRHFIFFRLPLNRLHPSACDWEYIGIALVSHTPTNYTYKGMALEVCTQQNQNISLGKFHCIDGKKRHNVVVKKTVIDIVVVPDGKDLHFPHPRHLTCELV